MSAEQKALLIRLTRERTEGALKALEQASRIKALEEFISAHWADPAFFDASAREKKIQEIQDRIHADLMTAAIAREPTLAIRDGLGLSPENN